MNAPASLEALCARFLEDLPVRGYAVRTAEEYALCMGKLITFLAGRGVLEAAALTPAQLAEFQRWLYHTPTKRGSVRSLADQGKILAAVRTFCRYLEREGHLALDPSTELELPRVPRSLPKSVLTPPEARRILEAVNTTHALGYRDRTMLEVFYATGIRSAELRALRLADLNLDEGVLRVVLGKGGKDRMVPLSRIAAEMLCTYLAAVRPELAVGRPCDRIFLSCRGRVLDKVSLGKIVRRHAKAAGIQKPVTCHVWRHTCATHLLKNNANLRHVQDLLGHASLATTERYLHLTITELKAAHRRFHPRERDACREEKKGHD